MHRAMDIFARVKHQESAHSPIFFTTGSNNNIFNSNSCQINVQQQLINSIASIALMTAIKQEKQLTTAAAATRSTQLSDKPTAETCTAAIAHNHASVATMVNLHRKCAVIISTTQCLMIVICFILTTNII